MINTTNTKKNINHTLFLLAHYDDEIGIFNQIKKHLEVDQDEVIIFYLTSSHSKGYENSIRKKISIKILMQLGVKRKNIFHIGTDLEIPDIKLHKNMRKVLNRLYQDCFEYKNINKIYTHSYEGGHPDHDAANIIVRILTTNLNITKNTFQFPLYSGKKLWWIFFKLFDAISENGESKNIKISNKNSFLFIRLFFSYFTVAPKTILGLSLPYIFHMVVYKTQVLQICTNIVPSAKPHSGKLLYEKRKMETYESFEKQKEIFLDNLS